MLKAGANNLILLLGLVAGAAVAGESGVPAGAEPPAAVEAQEAELERRVEARTERAKREAEFNRLDRDGDGFLSREEVTAKKDLRPGPDALDRNQDGRISRSEFAAVESSSVGPERPGERSDADVEGAAAGDDEPERDSR